MPANEILELRRPTGGRYCIACNPVTGVYHGVIRTEPHRTTSTGLPVMIYGATPAELCDALFSAWELDDNNQLVSYQTRPVTVSTNYATEAEADANAAAARDEIPGLLIRPIKHPARDEWALIYSDHVMETRGRRGPNRAAILAANAAKRAAGHSKTQAEARAAGWR